MTILLTILEYAVLMFFAPIVVLILLVAMGLGGLAVWALIDSIRYSLWCRRDGFD